MRIPFTKMQGLGNDFIVINAITNNISLSKEAIKKLADRHFGIGCDQILIVEAPSVLQKNSVDFTYRIFNADGSEAEQCGNGARCLAKFVFEHNLSNKKNLVLATKCCKIHTRLEDNGQITVILNGPIFEPKDIPFLTHEQALQYNLGFLGYGMIEIGVVSVGNPHAVLLANDQILDSFADLGPLICNSEYFPERVNVNFLQILDKKHVKIRVYERGSGETLACGSGACASVVIGRLWGMLDSVVLVKLLGGNLLIEWDEQSNIIKMTGPAEQVFNGEVLLSR